MNYNDIGLYEFFEKLTYDESFRLSDSEMYSYIKFKTDNFDLDNFKLFRKELNFLSSSIKFTPPFQITNDETNSEICLSDFFEKYILRLAHNYTIEKYKDLNPEELFSLVQEYDKTLGFYFDTFINYYDAKKKLIEIQLYYKQYDFGLMQKYRQIIRFSELIFDINLKLFDKSPIENVMPKLKLKQPLTFSELYKSPFSENINTLFEQLRTVGLTDSNNIWKEWESGIVEKNETSKFYYYLKQKNVLNDYDKTPALICFNKKFGIEVYSYKESPKTERFVSIRTLINADKTKTKTKLLDKFEIVLNKWIEKIELK